MPKMMHGAIGVSSRRQRSWVDPSRLAWEALGGRYPGEPRGEIAIKGKGSLEAYFVEARTG